MLLLYVFSGYTPLYQCFLSQFQAIMYLQQLYAYYYSFQICVEQFIVKEMCSLQMTGTAYLVQ